MRRPGEYRLPDAIMAKKPRAHIPIVLFAGFAFLIGAPALAAPGPGTPLPAAIDTAEAASLEWLLRQMVPNDVVPAPDSGRRRLLLSYGVARDDPSYKYTYGRSFIYDDALAAVALTMRGRYREAELVLNATGRLIRPDGSLWFGYNTQNSWPDENDHDGAIVRTGALAWAGYAFTYYIAVREKESPGFAASDPLAGRYLSAAGSIASYLLTLQVAQGSDVRHDLLTGGVGASTVVIDASGSPAEVYSPDAIQWVSMEHNIDAWFFLRDLARIRGDSRFLSAADLIGRRLQDLWSDPDSQFIQGIHADGSFDTVLPLDGASWGALYLSARGRGAQAARSIAAMRRLFSSDVGDAHGFRPYGPEPVHADPRVNRYYYPGAQPRLWRDIPFIWGEGSFGAAAAIARAGAREEALATMGSLLPMSVEGGFKYASAAIPWQFAAWPSVASTSWFIIAAEILRGTPAAGLFWGP
jgi:hypothetical protein